MIDTFLRSVDFRKGYTMLKKIVFILCLMFLPVTMAEAYPNEPNGYASLYWGEDISQVQQSYETSFLQYTDMGAEYLVTIPDAKGELGMLGRVYIVCCFDSTSSLRGITIYIPRMKYEVESTFKGSIRDIAATCGAPVIRNGAALWFGKRTIMAVAKKPETVIIDLWQTSHIGSLR